MKNYPIKCVHLGLITNKYTLNQVVRQFLQLSLFVVFIFSISCLAAQSKSDSLNLQLARITESQKASILNELSQTNSKDASDKAIQYAKTALELARKYQDVKNEALALQNLCIAYLYNDIYDEALVNGLAALDIFEDLGDQKDLAYILSTIGWIYYDIENADLALNYHQKVLDIYLKQANKDNIAYGYNSLGLVYSLKNEYEQALAYYLKSLKVAQDNQLSSRTAAAYSNIGMTYSSLKNYNLALDYLKKALDLDYSSKSVLSMAEIWNQLAKVYTNTKAFAQAEECLEKARVLIGQSTSNAHKEKLLDNYEFSTALYAAKGDYKKAYEAFRNHAELRSAILSDDKTNKLAEMRLLYETEKKEDQIQLLEKQKKINRLAMLLAIGGFILFIVIAYLTYTKLREKNKKEQLAKQQLKEKLDFKSSEMTTFALHIAQRNEMLAKFVEALSNIKKEANETTARKIQKLTHQIEQTQIVNQDLEDFHLNVESEYQDFFFQLNKRYPNLTKNEKRLAAQLRLNLSNKDIASLNNMSYKSVEMARYRLRKKLELDSKVNLAKFFADIA